MERPEYTLVRKSKKWYEQQGINNDGLFFNKNNVTLDRDTFYQYDTDKDGKLTAAEFAKLLNEKFDTNLTFKQAENLMNQFSSAKSNGVLNIEEFEQMLQTDRRKEQCQISIGDHQFMSAPHYETVAEARKKNSKKLMRTQ